MNKYGYELWSGGVRIAKYKTLSQALLGALWRSRKSSNRSAVYVWRGARTFDFMDSSRCIATVQSGF